MSQIKPIKTPTPPSCNKELIDYLRAILKRMHTEECDYIKFEAIFVDKAGDTDWVSYEYPDW